MTAATILFAGTPDFAKASLHALADAGRVPAVVLTQPDRPAGRGRKLSASPVKTYAQSQGIEVWQPASLKDPDVIADIAALKPDLMVVAAYGLILPQDVLDIPVSGCVNVHASLLPRWRGAAPVQHAILSGDTRTGICLMRMEAGLDTGPVYARSATRIGAQETAGDLLNRLALIGADLLVNSIAAVLQGSIEPEIQDSDLATYATKIRKRDAAIDWTSDATDILRGIRAYNPVPGAFFDLDGEMIKCWRGELLGGIEGDAGNIVHAGKTGVDVVCGNGAIRLLEVQRPGRQRITAGEFAAQVNLADKRLN